MQSFAAALSDEMLSESEGIHTAHNLLFMNEDLKLQFWAFLEKQANTHREDFFIYV